jgi:hypothetical protein
MTATPYPYRIRWCLSTTRDDHWQVWTQDGWQPLVTDADYWSDGNALDDAATFYGCGSDVIQRAPDHDSWAVRRADWS